MVCSAQSRHLVWRPAVQYTNAIFVAGLSDSSNEEQSYIDNEDQYE
jgi:hypothetical protein